MYNNPYIPNYNPNFGQQNLNERIDNEIAKLQQMKNNVNQQPPAINQTFQLAPTNREAIRYANSIEDVQRDTVIGDTPYFSKDMSVVWIKGLNGGIRTYELTEIIPKDEKDMQIELLKARIEELEKGKIKNEQLYTNVNATEDEEFTSRNDETIGTTTKKSKSTGLSTVSTSKTK